MKNFRLVYKSLLSMVLFSFSFSFFVQANPARNFSKQHHKRLEKQKKEAAFLKKEQNLEHYRTKSSLKEQLNFVQNKIRFYEQASQNATKDQLKHLSHAEEILKKALSRPTTKAENLSINTQIIRIVDGVENEAQGQFLPSLGSLLKTGVGGTLVGHAVPKVSQHKLRKPIGMDQARKESNYLYNPHSHDFYRSSELANMTPLEIANLDISPHHPAWYDKQTFKKIRPRLLENFYQTLNNGITQALQNDEDIDSEDPNYDIKTYQKVLFFKNVYTSATSAKGKTEDAIGVDYKIKWGDEIAVEPMASRLYALSGARMTDANFAIGPGAENLVLVLSDPEDVLESIQEDKEEGETGNCYATTLPELKNCLLDIYSFDLSPYVIATGIIQSEDDPILKHHPKKKDYKSKKKYKPENIIGRHWVTFHESMLELKPKGFLERFGSSKMSNPTAINDRVARGSYLFNLWISNRDVKDDNNKGYLLENDIDIKGINSHGEWDHLQYMEGQHDLGLSLGSLFSAGSVNKLKVGKDFATEGIANFRFPVFLIFKPDSWKAATYSDSLWMAQKIASMKKSEIAQAVSASQWPDFAQKALLYKISARRNRIAELFKVTHLLDQHSHSAPSLSVPLRNEKEIASAEKRYNLPTGVLSKEMRRLDLRNHTDQLLIDGQINDCQKTVLIGLLVDHRHPSGLDLRPSRKAIPFGTKSSRCRYGQKL